jgi:hypothetical protein
MKSVQQVLPGIQIQLHVAYVLAAVREEIRDIATVNPDRKRTIGRGKFIPAPLSALDETELFVAQLLLELLRYILDVLANGECIDRLLRSAARPARVSTSSP